MWPWEHLAFGYVLYSGGRRVLTRPRPTAGAVVALAVGTQFPDLVDKPLAWSFDVLPSGLSLGHSLLIAVPLSLAVVLLARRMGRRDVGVAFVAGYLSHPFADALYYVLAGGELAYRFMLWPLYSQREVVEMPLLLTVWTLFRQFQAFLATPRGKLYLLFEGLLMGGALLLWLADGAPGFDARWVRRPRQSEEPTDE